MDVTVVVATYGDVSWLDLAAERAVPSASPQAPVVAVHAATLHEARNTGLAQVTTEFVVFLDADDELHPRFVERMGEGTADLRVPSVAYVTNGYRAPATVPKVAGHVHVCEPACLAHGNWIVVGACVRTDLVRQVGGWRDYPWSEDYDLWVRCWKAGASIETLKRAVYVAYVRSDSRNRAPARSERLAAHQAIAIANGLPVPA